MMFKCLFVSHLPHLSDEIVCSLSFAHFKLGCFLLLTLRVLCIFWTQILCQRCDLQSFLSLGLVCPFSPQHLSIL